ncbi:MAG TPA: hypothetical protein DEG17_15155 [Cyanobacteria bacterium UBA11149]|nr:hypothetical protein [Cyanobacteria bacterium UBA11367]HBE60129.1 hypothetical protein [Cyanobacteria bacterium UBA11366]HBK62706.1 hypothetical protein [Cyanobacteria bacterium UBA11166]HBR72560.1 hypothetical protein [Cyanobacteria bacterium UBA11159]HBS71657.1 hypothetical protein [Cyanobacteria bacterium UBA11153]HBW90171.1 hypothetical protein [Cyanobacteria bacterium UBA11149]HCA97742.1 hypothetical protein [Cyanobacteria bacterium UBA9226]
MGNGWIRDILVLQIESNLYQRQGAPITNFQLKKINFYPISIAALQNQCKLVLFGSLSVF